MSRLFERRHAGARAGSTFAPRRRAGRATRIVSTILLVAGVATLAWAFSVWRWEDPVTGLYGEYRQRQLAAEYEDRIRRLPRAAPVPYRPLGERRRRLAAAAKGYRLGLEHHAPMGQIRIPRLGLDAMVANGSDRDALRNGPGRDERTFMPGEGELVYIAGHRTTYTAPFSHIERLRRGDLVVLEVPYATFRYRVTRPEIVPKDAVDRLRSRGREELRLQASHPRFFSSQRYLVYAVPDRVRPRGENEFYDLWPALGATP